LNATKSKIETRQATAAVIGLGYVGLPLAMEIAAAGFKVVGIDLDHGKIAALNQGKSYIQDVPDQTIADTINAGKFTATYDFSALRDVDTVSICVPTPLSKSRDPDISFILSATEEIRKYLHPGQLIVLESTTYPGTTDELIVPELENSGLKVGSDFYVAFSPERIDPGNVSFNTHNTPKIVGGITPQCTEIARLFYSAFIERVIPVSSTKCAEMVKLLENTFRSVNIGLVNEIALMCNKMDIDVWEVIRAAATKPFGFMPFYPGPGLGGHCIPIDPFYLSWKARASGFEARFIELAGYVNGHMPDHVVDLVGEALNRHGQSFRGSRVLVVGVAYKSDIDDVRESPSLDIMEKLRERGAVIEYSDPYVPTLEFAGKKLESAELTPARLRRYDCVVIATAHKGFPLDEILEHARAIVDTRNALRGRQSEKIVRL
jgi:UDP-N-acetyl-D-glucosamine dehydrogenase